MKPNSNLVSAKISPRSSDVIGCELVEGQADVLQTFGEFRADFRIQKLDRYVLIVAVIVLQCRGKNGFRKTIALLQPGR